MNAKEKPTDPRDRGPRVPLRASILGPGFVYTNAAKTDVAETFRRLGFGRASVLPLRQRGAK